MRKTLLSLLLFGGVVSVTHASTISMDFTVGILSDSLGNPLPDNALVQIIASPDTSFSQPTTTSFLDSGSNDILLGSISFDSSTSGVNGAAIISLSGIDLATYPVANDYLIIRWFPSLTTSSPTPGTTTYGEFGYANDVTWVAGNAGSSNSYFFKTTSYESGPYSDSLGEASNTVSAVPEPSSYATVIGLFSLGLMLLQMRRRSRAGAKSA
jgi:hypothetical protein